MLIDTARHHVPTPIGADVCIVGAGAAGLTLARELASRGHGVCLLECGGERDRPATQALLEGDADGAPMPALDEGRLACLGGTTGIWSGWCRPLDPIELEERSWVPHSGWPFAYEHLVPYYHRAQEACGLGPFDYRPERWAGPGRLPLPLDGSPVRTAVFQFSAPLRFGRAHREWLAGAGHVRALLNATVLSLEPGDGRRAVTSLRVATPGGEVRAQARAVVLAAGGIENARLLLLSGLGNDRDLVGRCFMEHPYLNSGVLHGHGRLPDIGFYEQHISGDGSAPTRVRGVLTLAEKVVRAERLVNVAIYLRTGRWGHAVFAGEPMLAVASFAGALRRGTLPPRPGRRLASIMRRPDQVALAALLRLAPARGPVGLRAFTEPVPDLANRVTLGDHVDRFGRPRPRVVWRVGELERRSLARAHELLGAALRAAELGTLEWWAGEPGGVGHHMGTTRMHRDPARGVVNEHGRVHGVANLFVAGSSVFPAAGVSNPTLTIVALAFRLAERLDLVLRGGVGDT